MASKDYLVGITIKNKNNDKIRAMLPCEEDKINTFFEVLENYEQKKIKSVNIYSKCGIKILEGKYKIVGLNDSSYRDKGINNLSKEEFKNFIVLLNNKLKNLNSLSNYSDIAVISECITSNIDDITSLIQNNQCKIFANKTLKEIAIEEENIKGKEDDELQYLMNSLGYFDKENIVVKVDRNCLNSVHLIQKIADSYSHYLFNNTKISIKGKDHIVLELLNKTFEFKMDILQLFDEYFEIECKEKTNENILKELKEEYDDYFSKEFELSQCNSFEEYEETREKIDYHYQEFIEFRENIQEYMFCRIEDIYINEADWFWNIFDFTKPNEIQKYYDVSEYKEDIEAFICGELQMWYDDWMFRNFYY